MDAREATITALSKAIPEIAGSSLTTLSGLGAMCFMQFRIGYDLGLVLMKAIEANCGPETDTPGAIKCTGTKK